MIGFQCPFSNHQMLHFHGTCSVTNALCSSQIQAKPGIDSSHIIWQSHTFAMEALSKLANKFRLRSAEVIYPIHAGAHVNVVLLTYLYSGQGVMQLVVIIIITHCW